MSRQDVVLTTKEVVSLLQGTLSEKTLANWRCQGRGPQFARRGNRIFYEQATVLEWMEAQRHSSTREYTDPSRRVGSPDPSEALKAEEEKARAVIEGKRKALQQQLAELALEEQAVELSFGAQRFDPGRASTAPQSKRSRIGETARGRRSRRILD